MFKCLCIANDDEMENEFPFKNSYAILEFEIVPRVGDTVDLAFLNKKSPILGEFLLEVRAASPYLKKQSNENLKPCNKKALGHLKKEELLQCVADIYLDLK